MKHPSTLAYYGVIIMIVVQILRFLFFYLFGLFDAVFNHFLTLIDIFGMSLIANFFYRLHLQNKQRIDIKKTENEFKE